MSQRKKLRRRTDEALRPTLRDLFAIKQNIPQKMLKLVKIRVTSWGTKGELTMNPEDVTEILIHPDDWENVLKEAGRDKGDKLNLFIYGIPVVMGDS